MYIQPITTVSKINYRQAIQNKPVYSSAEKTLPEIIANNTKVKQEQNNLIKAGLLLVATLGGLNILATLHKGGGSSKKASIDYVKTNAMDFISLAKDNMIPTIENCKSLNPKLKKHLTDIINYKKAPQTAIEKSGITNPGNLVLISGPPGTGKSFYGKILAKSIDANYMEIKFSDFNSRWRGEHIENLEGIFKNILGKAKAEPKKDFVVVFNEIESTIQPIEALKSNFSSHNMVKMEERSTILPYIELIEKEAPNVTFIGTTNQSIRNNSLDGAFLSRFKRNIYEIDFPQKECLYEALVMNLNKMKNGEAFVKTHKDELVKLAEDMKKRECSFRDLNSTIDNAKNVYLEKLLENPNTNFEFSYLNDGLKNIQVTDGELLKGSKA